MSYTLVVVDVQTDFDAANGRHLIANVKREIRQAMKDNAAIIILEYSGCGQTQESILNLVDGYHRCWTDTKDKDDGSLEVAVFVRKHNLPKQIIKVCGVNTDCCVRRTVEGLTTRFLKSTINIVADACDSSWDHISGLSMLGRMPRVNVLTR
jgi:nicotinamidase-related amidase